MLAILSVDCSTLGLRMQKLTFYLFLFLQVHIYFVSGKGVAEIRLDHLTPCRGDNSTCNYLYNVCVGHAQSSGNEQPCDLGIQNITSSSQSTVAAFEFNQWGGSLSVTVEVFQNEDERLSFTDVYNFTHTSSTLGTSKATTGFSVSYTLTGKHPENKLDVSIRAYCEEHFFGATCDVYCHEEEGCHGNYDCDVMGNRTCKAGWEGQLCNIPLAGGEHDCQQPQHNSDTIWEGSMMYQNKSYAIKLIPIGPLSTGLIQANFYINGMLVKMQGTFFEIINFIGDTKYVSLNEQNVELGALFLIKSLNRLTGIISIDNTNITVYLESKVLSSFDWEGYIYYKNRHFFPWSLNSKDLNQDVTYVQCTLKILGDSGSFEGTLSNGRLTLFPKRNTQFIAHINGTEIKIKHIFASLNRNRYKETIYGFLGTEDNTEHPVYLVKNKGCDECDNKGICIKKASQNFCCCFDGTQSSSACTKGTPIITSTPLASTPSSVHITTTTPSPTMTVAMTTNSLSTQEHTLTTDHGIITTDVLLTTIQPSTKETHSNTHSSEIKESTPYLATEIATHRPSSSEGFESTTVTGGTTATHLYQSTMTNTEGTRTLPQTATPNVATSKPPTALTKVTTPSQMIEIMTPSTPPPTIASTSNGFSSVKPTQEAISVDKIPKLLVENMLKDEADLGVLRKAILNAWIKSNAESNPNLGFNISTLSIRDLKLQTEAYGSNGFQVCIFTYNLDLPKIDSNTTLYLPTNLSFEEEIQDAFKSTSIRIYTGSDDVFMFTDDKAWIICLLNPSLAQNTWETVENAIWMALNYTYLVGDLHAETRIKIRHLEEFFNEDGQAVIQVVYFIMNESYIFPKDSEFQIEFNVLKDYLGRLQFPLFLYCSHNCSNVEIIPRRFLYTVFVTGYVPETALNSFSVAMQEIWSNDTQVATLGCRNCSIEILDVEVFFDAYGTRISAIVYSVKNKNGSFPLIPLLNPGPTIQTIYHNLRIYDINNKLYIVYTNTSTLVRYQSCYSVILEGKINLNLDLTQLNMAMTAVWRNYTGSELFTAKVMLAEEQIDLSGMPYTKLIISLYNSKLHVNVREVKAPPIYSLASWLSQSKEFTRTNQELMYTIVTNPFQILFPMEATFSLYIQNFKYESDMIDVQASLLKQWSYVLKANLTITILEKLVHLGLENRNTQTLTRVIYMVKLTSSSSHLRAFTLSVSDMSQIVGNVAKDLESLPLKYKVHTLVDHSQWIEVRQHFEMFFHQKITVVDYDSRLQYAIMISLQQHWSGFVKGMVPILLYQEEVVSTNISYWRVIFFIKYNNAFINPVSSLPLQVTGNWINISTFHGNHIQSIQTPMVTQSLLYGRDKFRLVFTSKVSRLDWTRIQQDLQHLWCRHFSGCTNASNILITILRQDRYTSEASSVQWHLVYFVRYQNKIISSQYNQDLVLSKDIFTWTNAYHTKYMLVHDEVSHTWNFGKLFHLFLKEHLSMQNMSLLIRNLEQYWLKENIVSKTCRCLSVEIVSQQPLFYESKHIWRIEYTLAYNKQIMDASLYSHLNITKLEGIAAWPSTWSLHKKIDWHLSNSLSTIVMSQRLSTVDLLHLEQTVTKYWLTVHPDFQKVITNFHVFQQEEVVDMNGNTKWMVYNYFTDKNGHYVDISVYPQINWLQFQKDVVVNNEYGHKITIEWNTQQHQHFTSSATLGKLFFLSWVPASKYPDLILTLKQYYSSIYRNQTVQIEINSHLKEYLTATGGPVWQLPFIVKIDHQTIVPTVPDVDWLNNNLNMTLTSGQQVEVISNSKVTSSSEFYTLHLDHSVSQASLNNLANSIVVAWQKEHKELNTTNVQVEIGPQQELVTVNGYSVWKIHYKLKINGSYLHSNVLPPPPSSQMSLSNVLDSQGHVVNISTNGNTGVSTGQLVSFHVRPMVSVVDISKVENKLTSYYEQQFSASTNVSVKFVKQKQLVTDKGESVYQWFYSVAVNNTLLRPEALVPPNSTVMSSVMSSINSSNELHYHVTTSSISTSSYPYDFQFPIYTSSKVSTEDKLAFKHKIEQAWLEQKGWNVSVDIHTQEEIVDNTGKSIWKLVCFVKNQTGQILDGRLVNNINVASISDIQGPQGVYHILNASSVAMETKYNYNYAASFSVNHQFGVIDKKILEINLAQIITKENHELQGQVTVKVNRQEEIVTESGEKVWRVVYFIHVNGEVVPASSIRGLNLTHLQQSLDGLNLAYHVTGSHNVTYNYRDRFSVVFATKVATESLKEIEDKILMAWRNSVTEYKQCGCLSMKKLVTTDIEEVLDKNGRSYWVLTYYLRKNNSVVESMTHTSANFSILHSSLSSVLNPKGQRYSIVATETTSYTRASFSFSFFMKSLILLNMTSTYEEMIKTSWESLSIGISEKALKASIERQVPFVNIITGQTIWKVQYSLKQENKVLVHPSSVTQIVQDLWLTNFQKIEGHGQVIKADRTLHAVDLRWSFSVFFKQEVKLVDFVNFQKTIEKLWIKEYGSNITAVISSQHELFTLERQRLWSLQVFIREESHYLDGREYAYLNASAITASISFTGVNNQAYVAIPVTVAMESAYSYSQCFHFGINHAISYEHQEKIVQGLTFIWQEKKEFSSHGNISVHFLWQEPVFTNEKSLQYQVSYILKLNDKVVAPSQVGNIHGSELQKILDSYSTSEKSYKVTGMKTGQEGFRFKDLFHIDLTIPVIDLDIGPFEEQMGGAWEVHLQTTSSLKVEVVHQDEYLDSMGQSFWRIYYVARNDSVILGATQFDWLKKTTLHHMVNLTKSGTNQTYVSHMTNMESESRISLVRDLYHLYFKQRIAVSDVQKVENALFLSLTSSGIGTQISRVIVKSFEEVIDEKKQVLWKTSYHIVSKDIKQQLTPELEPFTIFVDLNITSQSGEKYEVMWPTGRVYRLSHTFSLVIDNQVYHGDLLLFHARLLDVLQTSLKQTKLSIQSVLKRSVISVPEGAPVWQYNFVISLDTSATVDFMRVPAITLLEQQAAVSFTSSVNQQYSLYSGHVQLATDAFTMTIVGIQDDAFHAKLKTYITQTWSKTYSNITRTVLTPGVEATDKGGNVFTRYRYFVYTNDTLLYPTFTLHPLFADLQADLNVTLSQASNLFIYEDSFRVLLKGSYETVNVSSIENALRVVWTDRIKEYCKSCGDATSLSLQIVNYEAFTGLYGLPLLGLSYQIKGLQEEITPRFMLPPPVTSVVLNAITEDNGVLVYTDTKMTFRKSLLFDLYLTFTPGSSFNSTDRKMMENILEKSWQDKTCRLTNCTKVSIQSKEDLYNSVQRTSVSQLSYSVQIQGQFVDSRVHSANLIHENAKIAIEEQWTNIQVTKDISKFAPIHMLHVVVDRPVTNSDWSQISHVLQNSWKLAFKDQEVSIKLVSMENSVWVTQKWSTVTKISYQVIVQGQAHGRASKPVPEVYASIRKGLKTEGKTVYLEPVGKQRKNYLIGGVNQLNSISIKEGIKSTWVSKNTGIRNDRISINVKINSNAGSNSDFRLVGKNGETISRLEYTVSVNGQEPEAMFVDFPANVDLELGLQGYGTSPCHCAPRLGSSVNLLGAVNRTQTAKVTEAVKKAFVQENAGYSSDDFVVEIQTVHDAEIDDIGQTFSTVDYIVGLKNTSADVEQLTTPTSAKLSQSLYQAGVPMYSTQAPSNKKDDDEKSKWKLPVGIACGVLAAVIVVVIAGYVVHNNRHQKKGDLLEQETKIRTSNTFDEEHFSDPALSDEKDMPKEFSNPSYSYM